MTQSTTHPYQPNRSEQELLREVARVDRMQHQLLAEEQELPKLRTQWFAGRVAVRNQRFQQEAARLQKESYERRCIIRTGPLLVIRLLQSYGRVSGNRI